jgi:hypothetical protein
MIFLTIVARHRVQSVRLSVACPRSRKIREKDATALTKNVFPTALARSSGPVQALVALATARAERAFGSLTTQTKQIYSPSRPPAKYTAAKYAASDSDTQLCLACGTGAAPA